MGGQILFLGLKLRQRAPWGSPFVKLIFFLKKLFVFNFLTSTTKIMKTHYWYRSRFEENLSKFFRNFRGKFFGQNFFFTFSTFQVKIHTLTKNNRKKKFFFFDVRQNWRQTKIDVWYLKLMAQSSLSFLHIVFQKIFMLSMKNSVCKVSRLKEITLYCA